MQGEHMSLQKQEATLWQILSVLPLETWVKFIFHNSPTPGWVPGRVRVSGSRRGCKVGSEAPKQLKALIPQRNTEQDIQLLLVDSDMLGLLLCWIPWVVICFDMNHLPLSAYFWEWLLKRYFWKIVFFRCVIMWKKMIGFLITLLWYAQGSFVHFIRRWNTTTHKDKLSQFYTVKKMPCNLNMCLMW